MNVWSTLVYAALSILAWVALTTLSLGWRWKLRKVPGQFALPLVGHLPEVVKTGSPVFMLKCKKKYGPIFQIWFGRVAAVAVADPELVRQAGTKLQAHPGFRDLMTGRHREIDDVGLVAARDVTWRRLRTAWQPTFSAASLAGYVPLMSSSAQKLCSRLEELRRAKAAEAEAAASAGSDTGGPPVRYLELCQELGNMTLQVVGGTAYGVDFHLMDEQRDSSRYGARLVDACRDVFQYASITNASKYGVLVFLLPELRWLWVTLAHWLPDLRFTKMMQARTTLLDISMQLINGWKSSRGDDSGGEESKALNGDGIDGTKPTGQADGLASGTAMPAASPPPSGCADSTGTKGRAARGASSAGATAATGATADVAPKVGSFLAHLLEDRSRANKAEAITDTMVVSQTQTFLLAGFETTAGALAFSVYCLASNPEAEERLLREVDAFGRDRPIGPDDLDKFLFVEAVINEAMRLYPPAAVTTREVLEDGFQLGGYAVPRGTNLFLSIYTVHHDPEVWPRAEEFLPQRFLPDGQQELGPRVPGAHFPFGFGSRMCIGWKFAMAEAKIALVTMYQRFTFELEPGQVPLQIANGITMRPRHGLHVNPKPRL